MAERPTGYTKLLARHVAQTGYNDLPKEVIHQAKRVILDLVGCALGGSITDPGTITAAVVRDLGGLPEATVLGSGIKTSFTNAAYANARLGNILDADETYCTSAHFASTAVFAALAICERRRASGKDLITATVVGFDLAARIAMAIGNPFMAAKGEKGRGSGDARVFAAAGGASKALGLSEEQVCHALGITGTNSPLGTKYVLEMQRNRPPHIKYGDYASNALTGVMAALNAQKGFTAFDFILDGDSPFWGKYGEGLDFGLMLGKLGERWYIMDTTLKPWPCCRLTHPALTAFSKIIDEYQLAPEEIEAVNIRTSVAANSFFDNQNTTEMMASQFNFPYATAMIAHRVLPGPGWYTPQMLTDPRIKAFRKRVVVKAHPAAAKVSDWVVDGQWRQLPAEVIVTARGRSFESETDWAKGDPWAAETYFTDDELRAKFKDFATPVAIASGTWQEQLDRIIDMVYKLEEVDDIGEVTELLSPYGVG